MNEDKQSIFEKASDKKNYNESIQDYKRKIEILINVILKVI